MAMNELVELRRGNIAWTVEAPRAEILGRELLERVPSLGDEAGAVLVKRSLQRTVHQVSLSDSSTVMVKAYRLRRWKDRLKRVVFGPKPRIEWDISRRLLALGVPASHAVAVGLPVGPPGDTEGYLVVEALPGVETLTARLGRVPAGGEGAFRAFLGEVAAFVRGIHDRGVTHHDLHTGNILVRAEAAGAGERFLVIDLHRVGVGRAPSARARARALAQLLQSVPSGVLGQGEARVGAFLDAYLAAGPPLSSRHLSAEAVLARIRRRGAERLRSRAKRCLRESSAFTVEEAGGWRVHHRRDWSAEAILALWDRHKGAGVAASRFEDAAAEGAIEVREYPPAGGLWRLWGGIRWHAGLREYARAHRAWLVAGRGPKAVAAGECLAGQERGKSFAVLQIEAERGEEAE